MKKIICLLTLLLMLFLSSCDDTKSIETVNDNSANSMFVEIEQTMSYKVVYHKTTKVMYAVSDGSYNHGTFTLLVNADGTPMLYGGK